MKILSLNPQKLDLDTWVAMLNEATNLFKSMGSAMSMAFSGTTILSYYLYFYL